MLFVRFLPLLPSSFRENCGIEPVDRCLRACCRIADRVDQRVSTFIVVNENVPFVPLEQREHVQILGHVRSLSCELRLLSIDSQRTENELKPNDGRNRMRTRPAKPFQSLNSSQFPRVFEIPQRPLLQYTVVFLIDFHRHPVQLDLPCRTPSRCLRRSLFRSWLLVRLSPRSRSRS